MSAYPDFDGTQHCQDPDVDPERFHPRKGDNGYTVNATKNLCTGTDYRPVCPFLDDCREYGVTHAVHGIWGGLGEDGRKAERKARRIIPEPLATSVIKAVANTPHRRVA